MEFGENASTSTARKEVDHKFRLKETLKCCQTSLRRHVPGIFFAGWSSF